MLQLRPDQLAAFQDTADAAFVRDVAAGLRQRHPAECRALSEGQLHRLVREAVSTGRDYGLTWESTLAMFAALTLVIGPRFHEHPAIRAVLEEPDDTADKRMLRLPAMISDEVWFEAKARDFREAA